ncbi:GNAT family N-acetyltransferase [Martelella alba]|uniref:GNAT family N-acetyltransferase n=1 Tax=Martelella alba TaxID=2590451 RepID=A0A506UIL8_9HYPH|nr:GNAT family N-acetyltransferase [Martelella alba]TPW33165.1 GNAT family N-acetyltransferase [Martelella alba]
MLIAETDRLIIRNWRDRDRDLYFEINSDDRVMEFFPMRRSRAESDAIFDQVRDKISNTGLGFFALELKELSAPIGFCGLNDRYSVPVKPEGTYEIGWRLAARYWGKGYASEAARALLALGFDTYAQQQIVAFAVASNHRSTAVMERLGMWRDLDADFNHPAVPDSHPQLKRHVLYRIMREDWLGRAIPERG